MALWDLLKNLANNKGASIANTGNSGGNLFTNLFSAGNSNTANNTPQLPAIQLGSDGNIDPVKSAQADLQNKQESTPLTLKDRLFGREMSTDIQTIDPNNGTASMQTITNYKPGFLNDFNAGMNENFNNGFAINNWTDNLGEDGRKKGIGYRIGEGLGSFARGLATWGGDAFTAGSQGLDAAMKRQSYRTGDKLFRDQLKNNYGYTDEDLNKIQGFISRNDFNTLANSSYRNQALQVRQAIANAQDNTKRANMIMQGLNNGTITPDEAKLHMANYGITLDDLQRSNASRNADMNQELLPYKKYALQMTPQIAAGNLQVAQGNLGLRQALLPYQIAKLSGGVNNLSNADRKTLNENSQTLADIDAGLKLIAENPNAYTLAKGMMGSTLANRIDPKGVKTRTQIDNITAVYRKWLTGAQMSDAERKAYERFLPAPTDNAQIVTAKLQGMRDSIERKNNVLLQNAQNYQNNSNPLGLDL